jgi:hypothetical protein
VSGSLRVSPRQRPTASTPAKGRPKSIDVTKVREMKAQGRGATEIAEEMVIAHTIGGYREANEGQEAAELRKSGFATLTYDSFDARGMTSLASRSPENPSSREQ